MKKAYDFSKGKRGAVISASGKTRITIYMDDAPLSKPTWGLWSKP